MSYRLCNELKAISFHYLFNSTLICPTNCPDITVDKLKRKDMVRNPQFDGVSDLLTEWSPEY